MLVAISTTAIVAIARSYGQSTSMPPHLKKVLRMITRQSHLQNGKVAPHDD
jgi:hypothetical protein